jgi:drug/metabolite transporter (DMT)-like permease
MIIYIIPVNLDPKDFYKSLWVRLYLNSYNQSLMTPASARSGYLSIAFGVLMIATGAIFVKTIHANGFLVAFWRLVFAALILTGVLLVRGRGRLGVSLGKDWKLALAGAVIFTINMTLWCVALTYVPVANVTLLDNTAPLWVGILGWLFLRKHMGSAFWVGLFLALIGAAVMVTLGDGQGAFLASPGNLLGVLCGFTYGIYLLITARVRERIDSLTYTWLMAVTGALLLLPVVGFSGLLTPALPMASYGLIFLMSLTSQVIGWVLINYALGHLPTGAAAVTLIGQPVLSTVLGALLIGEVPSTLKILGGLLCLIGIFIVHRYAAPVIPPSSD